MIYKVWHPSTKLGGKFLSFDQFAFVGFQIILKSEQLFHLVILYCSKILSVTYFREYFRKNPPTTLTVFIRVKISLFSTFIEFKAIFVFLFKFMVGNEK